MKKIPDIELAHISRFRGELMGLAMLFVILFHVSLSRDDPFYGLRRCGNVGVDMFLFLSGVGLWYAWSKQPSVRTFYRRRLLRILPTWFLVAGVFYTADYLGPRRFSKSIVDLIGDATVNWDFWLHDELTFWYVPAILMLYIFAPHYMRLISRHPLYRWLPLLMVAWCIVVQWATPIHRAVGHLEIFWSRVPIFFIGINLGRSVKEQRTLEGSSLWLLLLAFALPFATSVYLEQVRHGQFPLFVERMLYIPLTVSGIVLLTFVLRRLPQWANRALRFVGMVSLEVYLLHVQFVLLPIERYHLGYWPTFLLTVAITLPVAWALQKAINYATKKIHISL